MGRSPTIRFHLVARQIEMKLGMITGDSYNLFSKKKLVVGYILAMFSIILDQNNTIVYSQLK